MPAPSSPPRSARAAARRLGRLPRRSGLPRWRALPRRHCRRRGRSRGLRCAQRLRQRGHDHRPPTLGTRRGDGSAHGAPPPGELRHLSPLGAPRRCRRPRSRPRPGVPHLRCRPCLRRGGRAQPAQLAPVRLRRHARRRSPAKLRPQAGVGCARGLLHRSSGAKIAKSLSALYTVSPWPSAMAAR